MPFAIALRIEVPGYTAAASLAPLGEVLQARRATASLLLDLGPDWLGRSLARHCVGTLRTLQAAGFAPGLGAWQARAWRRRAATAPAAWIARQFELGRAAFVRIFGTAPQLTGAPDWQASPHSLRLTQRLGFACASDTRGRHPFVPVWHGEIVRCPQLPVTLPTIAELLAEPRQTPAAAVDRLLALTAAAPRHDQVFALNAGPALRRQLDVVARLLDGWREQGYELISIQALAARLDGAKLPRHEVLHGPLPGRRAPVLLQGDEFLAAWR